MCCILTVSSVYFKISLACYLITLLLLLLLLLLLSSSSSSSAVAAVIVIVCHVVDYNESNNISNTLNTRVFTIFVRLMDVKLH